MIDKLYGAWLSLQIGKKNMWIVEVRPHNVHKIGASVFQHSVILTFLPALVFFLIILASVLGVDGWRWLWWMDPMAKTAVESINALCFFSVSWEWDNRLVAPPSPTPCWGHKSDRHQWKTAVKTSLWDCGATVMTKWGWGDLYHSRRRLNSSWTLAMETRLWVFAYYPMNKYICCNFAGWESKFQHILTAISLKEEREDLIWLL